MNSPSTSTVQATRAARSSRCSPQPMPPRRSRPAPHSVTSRVPSNSGTRRARAPRPRAAAIACGRRPRSPPPRSATSERSSWPGPRSSSGRPPVGAAWGHERLGRYLWASGQLDESRVEFALATELLADQDDPEAAAVFAGLGSAELMSGHYATAEHWCARVFDVVPTPADHPAAWVMATRVLGIVRSNQGDPDQARRTLSSVGSPPQQSAHKRAPSPTSTCALRSSTPVTTRRRRTRHSTQSRRVN